MVVSGQWTERVVGDSKVPHSSLPTTHRPLLRHRHELHAHAFADLHRVAGFLCAAGCLVSFPHANLSAILTGNQHPLARGVDVEVSWSFDVACDVAGGDELVVLTDLEDGDAVVSAVGNVHEPAIG